MTQVFTDLFPSRRTKKIRENLRHLRHPRFYQIFLPTKN